MEPGLNACKTMHPRNLTRPQDVFNGTWNEVSKTNIDELMKKIGYDWTVRKVANIMGMTLVLKGSSLFRKLRHFYNVLTLIGESWKNPKRGTLKKSIPKILPVYDIELYMFLCFGFFRI